MGECWRACSPSLVVTIGNCRASARRLLDRDGRRLLAPRTLDLTTTADASIPEVLLYNVYEGLVKLDPAGKIVPLLASSWKVSANGRGVHVRAAQGRAVPERRPADGERRRLQLRARAEAAAGRSRTRMPTTWRPCERSRPSTAPTVRVTLKQRSNGWLYAMTGPAGVILDQKAVADDRDEAGRDGAVRVLGVHLRLQRHADEEPELLGHAGRRRQGRLPLLRRSERARQRRARRRRRHHRQRARPRADQAVHGRPEEVHGRAGPDERQGPAEHEQLADAAEQAARAPGDQLRDRPQGADQDRLRGLRQADRHARLARRPVVPRPRRTPTRTTRRRRRSCSRRPATRTASRSRCRCRRSATRRRRAPFVQSALEQVGITVKLQKVDFTLWLDQVFTHANYDMTIIAHVEARDLIKYADPNYYWRYDNKTVQRLIAAGDAAPDERAVARRLPRGRAHHHPGRRQRLAVPAAEPRGRARGHHRLPEEQPLAVVRRDRAPPWLTCAGSTRCSASRSSATSECAMRDGVVLRADVYRPLGGGVHPVLLIRLPYDKTRGRQQLRYSHPSLVCAAGLHGGRAGHARPLPLGRRLHAVPARGARTATTRSSGRPRCRAATGASACTASRTRAPIQLLAAAAAAAVARHDLPRLHGLAGYEGWTYNQGAFALAFAAPWAAFLALDTARRAGDEDGLRELLGALGSAHGLYWALPFDGVAARARTPRAVLHATGSTTRRTTATGALEHRRATTAACACPACTSAAGTTRS